jgi:DNA-binding response OmpR family regulator
LVESFVRNTQDDVLNLLEVWIELLRRKNMGVNEPLLNIFFVSDKAAISADLHSILLDAALCVETVVPQSILKTNANECSVIVIDGYTLGYEALALCRRLRLSGVIRPIILAWRHDTALDRAGCREFGADVVLARPFAKKNIVSTILSLAANTHTTNFSISSARSERPFNSSLGQATPVR